LDPVCQGEGEGSEGPENDHSLGGEPRKGKGVFFSRRGRGGRGERAGIERWWWLAERRKRDRKKKVGRSFGFRPPESG